MPWQLAAAAAMLVVLAALATLQYRWLGEVSRAEQDRMRATLRSRASDFSQEFDAELTRTYLAFHVDGDRLDADPARTLTDALAKWQSSAKTPGLIRALYILSRTAPDGLQQFDLARHTLAPADWPPDLAALREATSHLPVVPGISSRIFMADAIDSRTPALVIGIPRLQRIEGKGTLAVIPDPTGPTSVVLVVFDRDRLDRDVLDPLVTKYFGAAADSAYVVHIVRRDDGRVVFPANPEGPVLDRSTADVSLGMFDLRMDEINRFTARAHEGAIADRVAITIVRRANGPDGPRVLMSGGAEQGAWEVRVRHRAGSLESIVERSRRRNLAISLGVLGLLGASVALVIGSAQRQQRLARQQMEFVAAVSHELRTPLAVICSAGENLADGVVADPVQVKRYGSLVETEGRRLGAMVERVLDFAGINSSMPSRTHGSLDVSHVIVDAVRGLAADAHDRDVTIRVHTDGGLPHVVGDADALRSALQNVMANAVKYSERGSTVDVRSDTQNGMVRIRVVDRGLGIDRQDLPHIFKPFYRGRRALDAAVRGTGVGLSVVRHAIDSHRGRIHVDSIPGEGTTVTIELPAEAPAAPGATSLSESTT